MSAPLPEPATLPPTPHTEPHEEPPSVTFHPPLYLQRRGWVFSIMRRERVREVLDVGCGEAELLACLCNPAPWLPWPHSAEVQADDDTHLRPYRLHALEPQPDALALAVAATAPPPTAEEEQRGRLWLGTTRWDDLEVNVWKGGLEVVNESFKGVECIVATEVIEHLEEPTLQAFAPVLLGIYQPRLLLLTTPSYTFNARFSTPSIPFQGYPDPTLRTTRQFRHSDHKFEWTRLEFERWCAETAEQWGYEVETSGVGQAEEVDKWGRDEECGWASSCAVFKRKEESKWAGMRDERAKAFLEKRGLVDPLHELVTVHLHAAHPRARRPGSPEEIREMVTELLLRFGHTSIRVLELFFEREVGSLCGGWLETLVQAIEGQVSGELVIRKEGKMEEWVIEAAGELRERIVSGGQLDDQETGDFEFSDEDTDFVDEDNVDAEGSEGVDSWSAPGWGGSDVDWSTTDEGNGWYADDLDVHIESEDLSASDKVADKVGLERPHVDSAWTC